MAIGGKSTRLGSLRISGGKTSSTLTDALLSAKIKLSASSISELEFEFADTATGYLARQSFLRGGTISYAGWQFTVIGVDQRSTMEGMSGKVVAQSKSIHSLKRQTGAKKWGKVNRARWIAARARSVGMSATVQDMGTGTVNRKKKEKGKDSESSWDLMNSIAKDRSALIFEYGKRLVVGSPAYLVGKGYGGRDIGLWWHNKSKMHAALVGGGPVMSWDESSDANYSMSLELSAPDAHLIRPGDTIRFSKASPVMYRGPWLVTDVDLDAATDNPVSVKAVRVWKIPRQEMKVDTPKKKTPKKKATKKRTSRSTSKKKSTSRSISSTSSPKTSSVGKSRKAQVESWGRQYIGRSVDYDGGYGAQCVDGFKMFHAHFVGGPTIRGNGKDNVNNAVASGLYSRVSLANMQPGDVISWGSSWGRGYGHVGVALGRASGGKVYVWNQLNGVCRFSNLSTSGIVGVARPRRWRGGGGSSKAYSIR